MRSVLCFRAQILSEHQAQNRYHGIHRNSEYIDLIIIKHFIFRNALTLLVGIVQERTYHSFKVIHNAKDDQQQKNRTPAPGFYRKQRKNCKNNRIGMEEKREKYQQIEPEIPLIQHLGNRQHEDRHCNRLL